MLFGLIQSFNHGLDSPSSTLTLPVTHPPPPLLSLVRSGLCFVHGPRPRLLRISLSKRKKNSRGNGFARPVHRGVFSARVTALDIHWMASLWKTATKS